VITERPDLGAGLNLRNCATASFRRLERMTAFHPLLKFKLDTTIHRKPDPQKKGFLK
jgi:hypothetical protein